MVDTCFSIEGRNVLSGGIYLSTYGAWFARLTIEGDSALATGGQISIAFPDGLQEFKGTIKASTAYSSRTSVEVIGGMGGLGITTEPQQFREATAKVILSDLARQGGESLSASIDSALLGQTFTTWAVLAKTVGFGITTLADSLKASWVVLPSGDLWLGTHAWDASEAKYDLLNHDTEGGYLELAPGDGAWGIRPGQSVGGYHVTEVTFRITKGTHRIALEYD